MAITYRLVKGAELEWAEVDANFQELAQGIQDLNTSKADASAIANFETSTQLNARDTANRDRANHSGAQAISTIAGLSTQLTQLATDITNLDATLKGGVPIDGDTLKKLNDKIIGIQTLLASDNVSLDSVQELVDAIETIQLSLSTILVNDLITGGVTKSLTAQQGVVLKGLIDSLQTALDGKATSAQGALADSALQPEDIGVSLQAHDPATAKTNVTQTWVAQGQIIGTTANGGLTISSNTITLNLGAFNSFDLGALAAGAYTLANPTGLAAGASYKGDIKYTTPASGAVTFAYGSAWDFDGATPSAPTTTNATVFFDYSSHSATNVRLSAPKVWS